MWKEDRHQHGQVHGYEERRHVLLLFHQAHDGNTRGQISTQGMSLKAIKEEKKTFLVKLMTNFFCERTTY